MNEEDLQNLMKSEMDYRGIFESAPVGIFRIGIDGTPRIVNQSMARICGYDCPKQMLNEVADFGGQVFVNQGQWRELIRLLRSTGVQCGIEAQAYIRNGDRKWVQLNVWAVREGDKIVHYEGTAEDITLRKTAEERMKLLAYHDSATGLPNRSLLEERLSEALAAARWKHQRVAVLLLEVGRFKMINDSLGKAVGDGLLQEIAERVRGVVGESVTIARLEGSEFAIIFEDVRTLESVKQPARQMIRALSAQFSFLGYSFNLSSAMGVSVFPRDGQDGQTLLVRADLAMYSAREAGGNEIRFFSEAMDNRLRKRVRLENSLRLALERHELFLLYQPQVNTRTGGISGLEALLRWQHPELGLVPPNEFIGVAESSGLIVSIGEWVLRTACLQARAWQDSGLPAVPVAVNVSAVQLRQPGFCELVRRVLQDACLDSKYLELELTEGLLLKNLDVMFLLQELREIGVKLTIDDFGTGYSSFSYLRQFKVNRLKIDRSFVRDVPDNADDVAITTAILNMARALNLDVLAEGVENAEQLDFLRTQHCDGVQGFYLSRPLAAEQVHEKFQGRLIHYA